MIIVRDFRYLLVAFLLTVMSVGSPATAQAQRPLLVEGTNTIYQRVLTRPGSALHDAPDGVQLRRYPAFQPLYVFARNGEWAQVGPSASAAPDGWIAADAAVDWRQNIVAAFTNASGRSRQILFQTEDQLRALMEHEAIRQMQAMILQDADAGTLAPEQGVVAVEPREYVNIREELYLMPILDFVEDLHPLNYDPTLLMKLASIPLEDEAAMPAAEASTDDFDAGIVFVLDTTQSMEPYIERTRAALTRIVGDIRGSDVGDRINFGVMAFRDNYEVAPGLEYRTRLLSDLERRTDQSPVLAAIDVAARVATANSPGFNEDSLAGVEDAIDRISWEADPSDPVDARYVILVTDAGPKDPRDPNARSDIGPLELRRDAEGRNIAIITLHLKTPAGGEAQHAYAAERYRELSRFGQLDLYYPIEGGAQEAFEATITRLVTALTDNIRTVRGEARVLSDDEAGAELVELGLAMRLAYLGAATGTQAPDVIEGWISDKAAEDPSKLAIEPRLLVSKNELATMAELVGSILSAGETTRGAEDASQFFSQIQDVIARMAQNPDRLVDAQSETLGGALEFLEDLPYRSQLLTMDEVRWSQSAMMRRSILDGMRQKLVQYRKWLFDPTVWTPLYEGAPDGEYVFAMPFDVLP